eukprot:7378588-Prymnesium_polylepis.2
MRDEGCGMRSDEQLVDAMAIIAKVMIVMRDAGCGMRSDERLVDAMAILAKVYAAAGAWRVASGRVGVWECGSVGVWECGSVG